MAAAWIPQDRWDALVRGDGCPMCAELASGQQVNEYGYTIAQLEISVLRLSVNQFSPGYCVLICRQHVAEPYQLSRVDRNRFFEDMMNAANALEQVYHPTKMNFQILGNALPHLHCHIMPRYYGDPAPGIPLNLAEYEQRLTPDTYQKQVAAIRAALA